MASSSSPPPRDQSTDKDFIDFMASDDEAAKAISKTEFSIRTSSLKRVAPSNSLNYNVRDSYTGEIVEGDFESLKKKYKRALIISLGSCGSSPPAEIAICTCSCLKLVPNMDDLFVPLAKKSLTYYNAKENTNLSFVKVIAGSYGCSPKTQVHINLIATSEDGREKLLFSELGDSNVLKFLSEHIDEFHVKGCCLLEQIESGNPIGSGCGICRKRGVIHPGPKHGCMVVGGDYFENYDFWGYRYPPRTSDTTPRGKEMYFACALIALKYFNSKQSTKFTLVEVMGSLSFLCAHKKLVHINFKGITSIEPKQQLFFAELVVPNFRVDCGKWDDRKGPFVEVKGCCLLEKVGPGNPFGRHCDDCRFKEVIHPGPKDGYRVLVGDNFQDYGFMNIGLGIF